VPSTEEYGNPSSDEPLWSRVTPKLGDDVPTYRLSKSYENATGAAPLTWSVEGRKNVSYVQLTDPFTELDAHDALVFKKPSYVFVRLTPSEVTTLPTWSVETPAALRTYWYDAVTFDSGS
jgi:hypothetical protein